MVRLGDVCSLGAGSEIGRRVFMKEFLSFYRGWHFFTIVQGRLLFRIHSSGPSLRMRTFFLVPLQAKFQMAFHSILQLPAVPPCSSWWRNCERGDYIHCLKNKPGSHPSGVVELLYVTGSEDARDCIAVPCVNSRIPCRGFSGVNSEHGVQNQNQRYAFISFCVSELKLTESGIFKWTLGLLFPYCK